MKIDRSSLLGQLLFLKGIEGGSNTNTNESNRGKGGEYFIDTIKTFFLPSMLPISRRKSFEIKNGNYPLVVKVIEHDEYLLSINIASDSSKVSVEFTVRRPITTSGTKFQTEIKIVGITDIENNTTEARKLVLFTLNYLRYYIEPDEL